MLVEFVLCFKILSDIARGGCGQVWCYQRLLFSFLEVLLSPDSELLETCFQSSEFA